MSEPLDLSFVGVDLPREERETVIVRADDEDGYTVTTDSPPMARKLAKLCAAMGIPLERHGEKAVRCILPVRAVSLRAPVQLSDEERARRAERLRESRVPA